MLGNRKTAMVIVAALCAVWVTRCGAVRDDGTTTNPPRDGGAPTPDSGDILGQPDASGGNPDGGGTPDGGATKAEATIPDLNQNGPTKWDSQLVHFTGVVTSTRFRISKGTTSCLYGVFMADPAAATQDYNGILVTSKSTIDSTTGNCASDSQLGSTVAIGDEMDVSGYFNEYCGGYNSTTKTCDDKDDTGKAITFPEISANKVGDIKKLGTKTVPTPPTVTVDDIYSAAASAPACLPYKMGANWWKYRAVYVKLANVEATNLNPDATYECTDTRGHTAGAACTTGSPAKTCDFCEWRVAAQGTSTPTVRVDDAVLPYVAGNCHRPSTVGAQLTELKGIVYWTFGNSKILPTSVNDATPALP